MSDHAVTRKIALEEHFITPELMSYGEPTVEDLPPTRRAQVLASLTDFSSARIDAMDRAGIDIAVLSVAGPGIQAEPGAQVAVRGAQRANDALAEIVRTRPARYAGFAHLAMQAPMAPADELERCISQLGFKGVMIDGQTQG